jgi:hypothetical protein
MSKLLKLGESIDTDAVVTFPSSTYTDSVWITVHLGEGRPSASVCILRTDEGVVLDVYPLDGESGEPAASIYAFDADLLCDMSE